MDESLALQGSGCFQAVTALSCLPVMANRLMVVGPTPSLIRTVLIGVKRSAKPISARGRKIPRNASSRPIRNTAEPVSGIIVIQPVRLSWHSSPGKEYELEVPPPVTAPPTVIASLVSGNFLNRERVGMGTSGMCRFLRLRTEQEDYEAT